MDENAFNKKFIKEFNEEQNLPSKEPKKEDNTVTKIFKKLTTGELSMQSDNEMQYSKSSKEVDKVLKPKPKMVMVEKNKVVYKCKNCNYNTRNKHGKCSRHQNSRLIVCKSN